MAAHPYLAPATERSVRYVVVDGAGVLASSVEAFLRASGAVRVQAGAWAADTVEAEMRLGSVAGPDLVVLVDERSVDPRVGEPWRRRGVPQLPVVSDASRVVVGPWVDADPTQPCLGCLHLTRTGRDLAWLAAHGGWPVSSPTESVTADEPLVGMGAAMAAMVALAGLGEVALPAGVSVEIGGPWPRVEHRRWERHTDCPNHGTRELGGAGGQPTVARVTMTT